MKSFYPDPLVSIEKKKTLNIIAWVLTVIVLLVVGGMRQIKIDTDISFRWLPAFYSAINLITAICLVFALYYIKRKNAIRHQRMMIAAMILSAIFLLGYVVYHITTPETSYCMEGGIRYIYFFLLISHVVLAAVIFPFILFSFTRAVTGQFERHRKLARIVFPFWFYVAITGPILFLMLRPCYNL